MGCYSSAPVPYVRPYQYISPFAKVRPAPESARARWADGSNRRRVLCAHAPARRPARAPRAPHSVQSFANERIKAEKRVVGAPDAVVFKGDDGAAPSDGGAAPPSTTPQAEPAPGGWRAALDRSGRMYWIDIRTQETTYRDPRTGEDTPLLPPLPPGIQVAYASDHRIVRMARPLAGECGARAVLTSRPHAPQFFINHDDQSTTYVDPRTGEPTPMPAPIAPEERARVRVAARPHPAASTCTRSPMRTGIRRPVQGRCRPRRRAHRPLRRRRHGSGDGVSGEHGCEHAGAGAAPRAGESPGGALAAGKGRGGMTLTRCGARVAVGPAAPQPEPPPPSPRPPPPRRNGRGHVARGALHCNPRGGGRPPLL